MTANCSNSMFDAFVFLELNVIIVSIGFDKCVFEESVFNFISNDSVTSCEKLAATVAAAAANQKSINYVNCVHVDVRKKRLLLFNHPLWAIVYWLQVKFTLPFGAS